MIRRRPGLVLEIGCWTLSVALLAVYFIARAGGELERKGAVDAFRQAQAATVLRENMKGHSGLVHSNVQAPGPISAEPAALVHTAVDAPDQMRWSESRVRSHGVSSSGATREERLPVALLRMDRVSLEVPVYMDISERNLNRGAGLVDGTSLPGSDGNVAIAAHRDGYFRALADVAVGDVLQLETLHESREYRVSAISIVMPTDLWPLHQTNEPAVTLITCYPFYFVGSAPQRYIVRAVAMQ